MFVKICVFFVSMFAALMTMFNPVVDVAPMQVEADPDFTPVVRFVVSSDSHVKKFNDKGCQRIMKMINTGYAAAEADENYNKLDAAIMVGDITDFGLPWSFFSIRAAVENVLKDETDFLAVAAKNHDSYLGRISRAYVSGISEDKADFHKVINGYHFIGLSPAANIFVHYSDKQIKWLDKQLSEAVAEDPSKPVFVFQHEHIYNTVYGSLPEDGWGVEFLTETLNKYPQVVDISGHSHYPANDPRAIWQGSFTAMNDGGLNYYEFTIDGSNSQHPESSDNMAHMLLVEVDAANRVKVRVCDLNAEKVLTEYMIDNVADPVKTKYSPAARKAAATAPIFSNDVKTEVNDKNVNVTFAPATPGRDDVVFIYRMKVLDENGETVASQRKLGDYYKTLEPNDISFSFNVENAGVYQIVLTAEDAWGLACKPYETTVNVK